MGREEEGSLVRHSRRRSSGREEREVEKEMEMGRIGFGELELGKQDFMSHEKWRELQLSDMDLATEV